MTSKEKKITKIAFIGTHGTAKTTTAHDLVTRLKKKRINAEFLGEVARMCPLPINQNATPESQKWIIFNQMSKEFEFRDKCDYLVGDRSVLDSWIYYLNLFGHNPNLEPIIMEHMGSYDFLFKMPIKPEYFQADGIRDLDLDFQRNINDLMDKVLHEKQIPYYKYEDMKTTLNIILSKK